MASGCLWHMASSSAVLPVHILLWGCSLLFFRANVDLLISAVSAPPEEKAPPQVRVTSIVEETD